MNTLSRLQAILHPHTSADSPHPWQAVRVIVDEWVGTDVPRVTLSPGDRIVVENRTRGLLRVAPIDIAFIKFLFESYEEVAVVRTMDRRTAIIVLLVSSDFLAVARGILDSLQGSVEIEEVAAPSDAGEDWLVRILREDEP